MNISVKSDLGDGGNAKRRIEELIRKRVEQAAYKAAKEVAVYAEKRLYEIFNEKIRDFYNSYTPNVYERKESLFNLLRVSTNIGETGSSIKYSFIPSEMSDYRNGYDGEDGLYDKVFRQGWHGGADKGDYTIIEGKNGLEKRYTPHPNPGTPYWRRPVPFYTDWYRPAEITRPSPLESVKTAFSEFSKGELTELYSRKIIEYYRK